MARICWYVSVNTYTETLLVIINTACVRETKQAYFSVAVVTRAHDQARQQLAILDRLRRLQVQQQETRGVIGQRRHWLVHHVLEEPDTALHGHERARRVATLVCNQMKRGQPRISLSVVRRQFTEQYSQQHNIHTLQNKNSTLSKTKKKNKKYV